MTRTNPWDAPPKTASWRRLATVIVPIVVGAGCTVVGTAVRSTEDSGTTGDTVESPPGTMPPTDTSDTGTP